MTTTLSPIESPPPRKSPLADYLPRDEAAIYLHVSKAAMADWASTGVYKDELPYKIIGRKAFYKIADLDRWIESR